MHKELLVIEDAELHLSILRKIAEQLGFKTIGAHSVAEAEELLSRRTFDCITLDLSLGEESGIEVLQLLAKIKCRTPVIVISASGEETCDETVKIGNFLNLNVCSPIPKPIHLAALRRTLTKIAEVTERQKLPRPAAQNHETATRSLGALVAVTLALIRTIAGTNLVCAQQPARKLRSRSFRGIGERDRRRGGSRDPDRLHRRNRRKAGIFRHLSIETDRKKITREAHSLKSAAGTFGYRRLAGLARWPEKNAARMTESEYRERLDGIDAAYVEARAQDGRETQHRAMWAVLLRISIFTYG